MKSTELYPALKYGLMAGMLVVLFATFKYLWLFTHAHPDLYLTLVALFFSCTGMWVYHHTHRHRADPIGDVPAPDLSFLDVLSKREKEVLHFLLSGHSNKTIAHELNISLSTLKSHINHIYYKAEVKNRRQLQQKLASTSEINIFSM